MGALLLIGAVQASFNARSWFIPLDEFLSRLEATPADRRQVITGTYTQGLTKHTFWLKITRYAYNFGVLFLLAGLAFVVVPKGTVSEGRYVVIGLATVGFASETIWFIGSFFVNRD